MAPHVVVQAMKTAVFAAALFSRLGFAVSPAYDEKRGDIIQAVALGSKEKLLGFCRGLQGGSPVDSGARPEGFAMPGYADEVVMAAGGFVQGSSIEISADGPIKEPYNCYMQGSLTFEHGILAAVLAAKGVAEA